MDRAEAEDILMRAYEAQIDIVWAQNRTDYVKPGVHLLNPTVVEFMEGLNEALRLGRKSLVVHSLRLIPEP